MFKKLSQTEKLAAAVVVGILAMALCLVSILLGYSLLSAPQAGAPPPPTTQQAQPPPPATPTPAPPTAPISPPTNTPEPSSTTTQVVPPTAAETVPNPTPVIPATAPIPLPTSTPGQPAAACQCDSDRYRCDSFANWSEAQTCFDYCMAQGKGDIHKLDQDNDLVVCESMR